LKGEIFMDISSVSKLVSGLNNTQGGQNEAPAIPGMPEAASVGASAGKDFGAASTYQLGQQPNEPENPFAVDQERVSRLWDAHKERVESFRQMVETLLGKQAERQGLAEGWSIRDIEITDELRAEAAEMVAEGGYFSVEETASRILDFAVALTGGDPAQIDVMRNAVQRAFDQTERMLGDQMPDITRETHAAVMKGFDEWAEAGNANAITLLNRGE
jgi:hypothetical protein